MRLFKIALYILLILVLQSVVFARLNFFGAVPDLVLVSVIIFAVLGRREGATLFAASAGFVQDILSHGIYINTVFKVIVAYLVSIIREGFVGEEFPLSLGFVAVFTPATLIFEGMLLFFLYAKQIDILHLFLSILLTTLYNLILVPVIFPIIKKLSHA